MASVGGGTADSTEYCDLTEQALVSCLSRRDRALSSQELAAILHIDPRSVRAMVAHLRSDHCLPICSTSRDGFWLARSYSDCDHTLAQMRSRVAEIQRAVEGIEIGRDKFFPQMDLIPPEQYRMREAG